MASLEGVKVGDVLRVHADNSVWPNMSGARVVARLTKTLVVCTNGERFTLKTGRGYGLTSYMIAEREATNENA